MSCLRSEPFFKWVLFQKARFELPYKYAALLVVLAVGMDGGNCETFFSLRGKRKKDEG